MLIELTHQRQYRHGQRIRCGPRYEDRHGLLIFTLREVSVCCTTAYAILNAVCVLQLNLDIITAEDEGRAIRLVLSYDGRRTNGIVGLHSATGKMRTADLQTRSAD